LSRLLAVPAVVVALTPFHALIGPLAGASRTEVKRSAWHQGCPVALSDLRVLTVSYVGFDRQSHIGQLVVNRAAAGPLVGVFGQLYRLRFRIHHMSLADAYGLARGQPPDGDVSSAFDCRQAVPSPCVGGSGTGTWSEHAFGEAVSTARGTGRAWSPVPSSVPSARSGGVGAATGLLRPGTTCTSRRPGTKRRLGAARRRFACNGQRFAPTATRRSPPDRDVAMSSG
jgi:hypothetical protein